MSITVDDLEFENGKLVKVRGMRPEYMSGGQLIDIARDLAILFAHPPIAADAEPVASIVPPHCSGTAFVFEPGVLHVNKDGSGYIAIDEDDFVLEDDRCEGPDGPEGSVHWIARMDSSEISALRDFLNGTPAAPPAENMKAGIEDIAKIVFMAMRVAAAKENPPDWVDGGNSNMQDEARRAARSIRSALTPAPQTTGFNPTHRHKKRGSAYEVIGLGHLQVDGDLDMERVTIYRGEDGRLWARPEYEFNDGRFEAVVATVGSAQ